MTQSRGERMGHRKEIRTKQVELEDVIHDATTNDLSFTFFSFWRSLDAVHFID